MTRFLVRRIGQAIVVVFIVSVMTFLLLHLLPGGAARAELGFRASPSSIRAFNIANGYNLPLVPQYFHYLGQLFHGNLGYSYKLNEPVSTLCPGPAEELLPERARARADLDHRHPARHLPGGASQQA